ncbi:MAG TPA: FadR/GntR family transcriptional regulator [Candidatus Hydrogenedentes bacterium]|nr:FadR/GntR family transcriptional regulator [Candidatus Hydrogenedentota bacterium]HPC17064.1 FadR/GntR family transcriptional regulator [Candidatus Hydrogenedentota bacterium]HRT20553.1 FadR/GntR family transcriptional regulator [Candidatus Hydrogenedentota bacterium]HRT65242.1 FadR/GntR family transcriptional regulator [Candidatus Hydrogenedentota bacterium]
MSPKRFGKCPRNSLAPLTRARELAGQLTRSILEGTYPSGSRLPTERELAESFSATRTTVREALKRLEALGLVRILQGSGIYVEDFQLTSGIELFDVLLANEDGSVNLRFLRDVLEFRGHMVRIIVRLAAVRRTPEELAAIREMVHKRRQRPDDLERIDELNLDLFRAIAEAAHNQVYRLVFNTMGRIYVKLRGLYDTPLLGFDQTQVLFERLLDAFEHQDDAMAELLIIRYMDALRKTLGFEEKTTGILELGASGEAAWRANLPETLKERL